MKNKKIQELVAKLQAENSEPLTEKSAEQEDKNTITEEVAAVRVSSGESADGYPNEYFEIVEFNGQPYSGDGIGLEYNDWFKVKVNYDKVVADFGQNAVLSFYGTSRMFHTLFSIYSATDEVFIGNYHYSYPDNKHYEVQLDEIFAQTGSADFIFKAKWDGIEALDLQKCAIYSGTCSNIFQISSLKIANNPDKMFYKEGEIFDSTGMTVLVCSEDGLVNEILEYDFYPKRGLEIEDKFITITYQGVSYDLPITVGPKYIYVETMPTKMSYLSGDTFNPTGMVVKKVYYDGEEKILTDYTLANSDMTVTNKTVTITYKHLSTQVIVNIYGQRIAPSAEIQESTNGLNWKTIGYGRIYFNMSGGKQTRTVVKIRKKDIDFGNFESVNLKMQLFTDTKMAQPTEFCVNGKRYRKPEKLNTVYVDIGVVDALDDKDIELIFTYCDNSYEFCVNGTLAPIIFLSRAVPSGAQKTVKEFPLVGNTQLSVDLYDGKATFIINDIPSDKALLGYGISHIYDDNSVYNSYGNNFRINLHEKLVCADDTNEHIKKYAYTDAAGNAHELNMVLYCITDGKKYYLNEDDVNDENKFVFDSKTNTLLFNKNPVTIEYQAAGNQFLLSNPTEVVSNSEYYKNATSKPVLWLKGNGLTKGFNKYGEMVMVNDEFGNYFTISYDTYGSISKITDCNGKEIIFDYDNIFLTSITDQRGRVIKFNYLTGYPRQLGSISFNGKTVNLDYDNILSKRVSAVIDSDGYKSEIVYNDMSPNYGGVKTITEYSMLSKVPEGTSLKTELSKLDFDYSESRTIITDSDENKSIYVFNDKGEKCEYFAVSANRVVAAEKYEYIAYEGYTTYKSHVNTLNKKPLDEFEFIEDEINTIKLDNYNAVSSSKTQNIRLAGGRTKNIEQTYTYDDEHRVARIDEKENYDNAVLICETRYKYVGNSSSVAEVQTRKFNGKSSKTKTETYTYSESGDLIKKSVTGSVNGSEDNETFISETSYDSLHRIIGVKDETGLNSVEYAYSGDTELINKITMPKGGKYFYTYDNRDRVTKMSAAIGSVENANSTEYSIDEISEFNHSGNIPITYEYDKKRRISKIYLNNELYESYLYEDNVIEDDIKVDKITRINANGEKFKAVADKAQSFKKIYYNGELIYESHYDFDTCTETEKDYLTGAEKQLKYDSYGNLLSVHTFINGEWQDAESYCYDIAGLLSYDNGCIYEHDEFNENITTAITGPFKIKYKTDANGRYLGRTVYCANMDNPEERVTYLKFGDNATNLPGRFNYRSYNSTSRTLYYTYDAHGNISTIERNGELVAKYTYDALDRLVREDNKDFDKSYFFTYDNNGNITLKEESIYTFNGSPIIKSKKILEYDNGRLISYNNEECEYDKVGNPVIYRGNPAEWTRGRLLASYNGTTFEYDAFGLRTKKNDIKFTYDSAGRLKKQSNGLEFFYDHYGLVGINYLGEYYTYCKDIQGNIVAILDTNDNMVVEYRYDAWGNHSIIAEDKYLPLANANPFRYRSYYYDTETGLYYLKTRYYDPEVGRFINIDSIQYADPEIINGLNLYAYCGNNPIIYKDENGTAPKSSFDVNIFSLFSFEWALLYSGRYTPKRRYLSGFNNLGNDLAYLGERFLSHFEARAISGSMQVLTVKTTGVTFIDANLSLFEGRYNVDDNGYLGLKVGTLSASCGIDIADGIGVEFMTTVLTIGAYTEHFDAEVLVGSEGFVFKIQNGQIKVGAAKGIGLMFTLKLW
ncbi:MAG: hypothetical protein J1G05_02135 [Clostridiales bacterium]|nr:hypothetical protein [Clostridiales bacterium]